MAKNDGKIILMCSMVALVQLLQPCHAAKEVDTLLNIAMDDDIKALRSLFKMLQLQYDFLAEKSYQKDQGIEEQFEQQYEADLQMFEKRLNDMSPHTTNTIFNTTLPTIEEIIESVDFSLMAKEQQMEFLDMQNTLQDTLNEVQLNLNNLLAKAITLEGNLHKINMPKIISLVFKLLKLSYKAAGRTARAAYCTYSYMPQLNTSLNFLHETLDCYLYTTSVIVKVQNETYQTVNTVKKNILELTAVYKKVANQNSLKGKIVLVILNITKIASNILETIRAAKYVLDSVENQLPETSQDAVNCASKFARKIPFITESISNVTTCALYVDDANKNYDFMKSEEEYNKEPQYIAVDNMDNAELVENDSNY